MQGTGGRRNNFFDFPDPFAGFGGFGGIGEHRSLVSNFFGGKDPFDDPFFTRPFGSSMFESSFFGSGSGSSPFMGRPVSGLIENQASGANKPKGPVIEELHSDDEMEENKGEKENPRKQARLSKEPYVEDPDDEPRENQIQHMQYGNNYNRGNHSHSQAQSFCFQSSTVTYGGPDGAYYTSSRTRRTGSDGVSLEECKEADTRRRQAMHKISRGLHNKGHSVSRKLNSDGKVDTMQTLHNLNEDELAGFEEAWKDNVGKRLPSLSGSVNMHDYMGSTRDRQSSRGGLALPSIEQAHTAGTGRTAPGKRERRVSSEPGKPKTSGAGTIIID